jgi:hypothetical protein
MQGNDKTMSMPPTDLALQDIVHRNPAKIQAGLEKMLDRKPIQIEKHQFTMITRARISGDPLALGLVLCGRAAGETGEGSWRPTHL